MRTTREQRQWRNWRLDREEVLPWQLRRGHDTEAFRQVEIICIVCCQRVSTEDVRPGVAVQSWISYLRPSAGSTVTAAMPAMSLPEAKSHSCCRGRGRRNSPHHHTTKSIVGTTSGRFVSSPMSSCVVVLSRMGSLGVGQHFGSAHGSSVQRSKIGGLLGGRR